MFLFPIMAAFLVQPAEPTQSLSTLEARIKSLELEVRLLKEARIPSSAVLDADKMEQVSIILASGLTVAVTLKSIEQFKDGSRVHLTISPLLAVQISSYKLTASWNKAFKKGEDYGKWLDELKERTFEMDEPLLPDRWNAVSFVLLNTKPSEVGTVAISLEDIGFRPYRPIK